MNILNNIKYFFEDLYWDTKFFIENKIEEHKWNKILSEQDEPFVGEIVEEVKLKNKKAKKKKSKKTL